MLFGYSECTSLRTMQCYAVGHYQNTCDTNLQRTGQLAVAGGVTGAAASALCCGNPVRDTGPGILIGIGIGALVGFLLDQSGWLGK